MIVSNTLNMSLHSKAEVKAEDTDILCLLVHHFGEQNNDMIMTTRNKSHVISGIANSLDSSQKNILLFIHSFSGSDTTSIYGFGKETILKKAAKVYEEVHLYLLLSVREPIDAIVDAGFIFNIFMVIRRGNCRPYDFNATQELSPLRNNRIHYS